MRCGCLKISKFKDLRLFAFPFPGDCLLPGTDAQFGRLYLPAAPCGGHGAAPRPAGVRREGLYAHL